MLLPRKGRFGLIDWRAVRREARAALEALQIEIDPDRLLGEYPVAVQQMVAAGVGVTGGIASKPIRFAINTHWHFDHTGGNLELKENTGARVVGPPSGSGPLSTSLRCETSS